MSISSTGVASLRLPVVTADGGDLCPLLNGDPSDDPPNLALLDKDWLSDDRASRRLAMSYTR